MDYVKLGKTGLDVSRFCLGCMSYGQPRGGAKNLHPWTLPEDESRVLMKTAFEAGINYFDTADVYSDGESERVLGRFVHDNMSRDQIVITTKVCSPWRYKAPNGKGLSRKAIITQVDKSLKNLGTDYIDIYMLHRWDYDTPIEETLETLNNLVRAGKILYLGASTIHAWQLMKAISIQRSNGWSQFIVMQNYYNLLYREEEREMMGMCIAEGIGVTPWSPLARGRLARPWLETKAGATKRSQTDFYLKVLFPKTVDIDKPVIDRVNEVATARGDSPSSVALAWMLSKPYITAPLVGATKTIHLEHALKALEIKLSDEEIKLLEEPYVPHPLTDAYV